MGLIGRQETTGAFAKLDDITSLFNGSATVFNLTLGGQSFFPSNPFTLLVSVAGVVQEPATDYTIVESAIKFTTPPANGASGFIVVLSTPSTSNVIIREVGSGSGGGGGSASAGSVINYSNGAASPFILSVGRVTQSINLDDTVANEDANIVVGGATIIIDDGVTVTVGEGKRLVSDLFGIVSDAFPMSEVIK